MYHKHAFKYHQLDSAEQMLCDESSRDSRAQTKTKRNIKWNNVTICEANYFTWLFEKLIFSSPFYYVYANLINNSKLYKKKYQFLKRFIFFLTNIFIDWYFYHLRNHRTPSKLNDLSVV